MDELVIVVKAYRSSRERAANENPLEEHEFKTIAEFDEVVDRLYSDGRYVAFSGKSGVKLASRDAARLLLQKAEQTERNAKAVELCTAWLSKNRSALVPYLKSTRGLATETTDSFVVTLAVSGEKGWETFSFRVVLETEEVTLKEEGE